MNFPLLTTAVMSQCMLKDHTMYSVFLPIIISRTCSMLVSVAVNIHHVKWFILYTSLLLSVTYTYTVWHDEYQ